MINSEAHLGHFQPRARGPFASHHPEFVALRYSSYLRREPCGHCLSASRPSPSQRTNEAAGGRLCRDLRPCRDASWRRLLLSWLYSSPRSYLLTAFACWVGGSCAFFPCRSSVPAPGRFWRGAARRGAEQVDAARAAVRACHRYACALGAVMLRRGVGEAKRSRAGGYTSLSSLVLRGVRWMVEGKRYATSGLAHRGFMSPITSIFALHHVWQLHDSRTLQDHRHP